MSASAVLFNNEAFSDWGLIAALGVTFFFASAGASSAYLTVSEIFPMEVRALAIAFFYAIGTAIGGITGPLVFESLASSGDPGKVAIGYLIGAAVMAFGGIVELFLGIRAEGEQLEDIAAPLTAEAAEGEGDDDERSERELTEKRHRERAERDRAGRRRYRLGPGSASYSPFFPSSVGAATRVDRCGGRPDRPRRRQRGRDRDPSSGPGGRGRALGAGQVPGCAPRGRPPRA